ncbi:MAG: ADOP family duplicated permease [Acidobacteriota bacterium]
MDALTISLRQLLKTPGFTAAAVSVLALGIGLNSGMFAVVHALAFASRRFDDPERLVQLYDRDVRTGQYRPFSHPGYQVLASRSDVFDGVLAHMPTIVGIGEGRQSRRTLSVIVSANYFEVLGVPLAQGRGFSDDESRPRQDVPVVVVTHDHWRRTGFDPALLGKTLRINERPFTIVGIAPRGFTGTMTAFGPELFFPLGVFDRLSNDFLGEASRTLERADAYNLFVVGRLRPGISVQTAGEAMTLVGRSLAAAFPIEHRDRGLSLSALPRFGTSTSPSDESAVTTLGVVLLGMTGAVMLTVCLNLAGLLLARGRGRRKEFAVRLALGGGRGRIVRQLLLEGLLLSLVGGALGAALGSFAIDTLLSLLRTLLPVTIVLENTVSPALVVATLFFCVLATAAFALGPALKHSRADILSDLKAHAGDDPAPRGWRFVPRNALVASQVALSLCLLIAAGLFLRMALGAALVDLGYRADDTVLAEVDSRLGGLDEAQSLDIYARVEQRLGSLPGVQAASVGALVPLGIVNLDRDVRRAGLNPPPGSSPATAAEGRAFGGAWNAVGPTYFEVMGIRLHQGRLFTEAETYARGAPPVVILDQPLARRLWPDGDALGQRVQWADTDDARPASAPMEVIGIVSATRTQLFENEPRGAVYVPLAQGFTSNVHFLVRPSRPMEGLVDAVGQEIRAVAPGVPLFRVRTFRSHLSGSVEYWMLRLSTSLFAFFGLLAMTVAVLGIYGVTAYAVARRTREIGVRMAVGARPAAVLRLFLCESLGTTLGGVAVGWLLGLGVGRVMASTFVDLSPFDPVTFTLIPAGLIAAAMAATWIPARRATVVNPVTALRAE